MTTKTILIADDDRDLVEALALRCRTMELRVVVAYDGITAINRIHEEKPDLVCLDVCMPSGSGLGVCEMLVSDERFHSIPMIILTGKTDHEIVRRCHDLCVYYVLKSHDVWERVEPLISELLNVPPLPTESASPSGV
jgi:two-component system alkaline phosphatase synthesis response regulator PhoP